MTRDFAFDLRDALTSLAKTCSILRDYDAAVELACASDELDKLAWNLDEYRDWQEGMTDWFEWLYKLAADPIANAAPEQLQRHQLNAEDLARQLASLRELMTAL